MASPRHPEISLERPVVADGADLWRLAGHTAELDRNSSYSYLLWCRDFAATSVVARDDGRIAGFVTGYVRPDAPDTLVVWQVAVAATHRRQGLAARMLDHLADRVGPTGVCNLETTVTPGNEASQRLFDGFADRRGAARASEVIFPVEVFPDDHDAEVLHRVGPW